MSISRFVADFGDRFYDGSSWTLHRQNPYQLAVGASLIPEPSAAALGLLAIVLFGCQLAKKPH